MLQFTRADLKNTADRILTMDPEPVPRFRLLREVFRLDPDSPEYRSAKSALDGSVWVRRLEESQLDDGTWGRFHTQDTKIKQPFPTTETAIRIALDSGLESDHRIFRRLMPTLLDYVRGANQWRDWPEKHDNPAAWPIWVRHFSTAALASIDPYHPAIDDIRNIRAESLNAAFASGRYDRNAETRALCRLLACRMKNPVPFHTAPSLLVLSATNRHLEKQIERSAIRHLFEGDRGIGYICEKPLNTMPSLEARGFFPWIRALYLISKFPTWREFAEVPLNAIWSMRNSEGLWTAGNIARKPFTCFPLSDSWRRRDNKTIDVAVELLCLLSTTFDA